MSLESYNEQNQHPFLAAADAAAADRAAFIRRTYTLVGFTVLAFVGLLFAQFTLPLLGGETFAYHYLNLLSGFGSGGILGVFALFMAATWFANKLAASDTSAAVQYAGLGLYTVVDTLFFIPLIAIGMARFGPDAMGGIMTQAMLITLLLFGGLTATVFMTRKDFSFLRSFVTIGSFVVLGVIIAGMLFGFNLGLWFSGAMILFMAAVILFKTDEVLRLYPVDKHVAAALTLFAAFATLLFYVLRFIMQRRD